MKRYLTTFALLAGMAGAEAAIVNHADVAGFRTFQDTTSGLVWADLDNFLAAFSPTVAAPQFASFNHYLGALQTAGFTWATTAEVTALLAGIPLGTPANASAAYAAMETDWGSTIEQLMGYADGGGPVVGGMLVTGHQLSWGNTIQWLNGPPQSIDFSTAPNLGLFAYIAEPGGGGSVPAPTTLALALASLALVAEAGMRRKALA